MFLGAHLGIAGGLAEAVVEARRIGCESLQIFSKSPQMWGGPALVPESVERFRAAVVSEGLRGTAVHHGYLANLASPKAPMLKRSRQAFADELRRATLVGADHLIFHPGAHLSSGVETGITTIAESLRLIFDEVPEGRVRVLLENAAGQGTTLGSSFEELATVLAAVDAGGRVGIALDTCHLFAAGFDLRTDEGYGSMVDRLEAGPGARAVHAFHLNDAKAPLGSHLDRHENIGRGELGLEGFRRVVNDPRWADVPGFLETPLDDRGYARYAEDLVTLRSLLGSTARPRTARKSRGPTGARAPPRPRRAAPRGPR